MSHHKLNMSKKLYEHIKDTQEVDEIVFEADTVNMPKIGFGNAGSDKFPFSDADCSIIALSLITGQPYQDVLHEVDSIIDHWPEDDKHYKKVSRQGDVLTCGLIDEVLYKYLDFYDWQPLYPKVLTTVNTPRYLPDTCLLRLKSHVVARIDGVMLDTFDSRFEQLTTIELNNKRILVSSVPSKIWSIAIPK